MILACPFNQFDAKLNCNIFQIRRYCLQPQQGRAETPLNEAYRFGQKSECIGHFITVETKGCFI